MVDYLVVEFPHRTRNLGGPLATELASLVDAELVALLEVVLVDKDDSGAVTLVDLDDLEDLGDLELFRGRLEHSQAPAVVDHTAQLLAPGHAAAVVVWENTWAQPIAQAALRAGGELVARGRVPDRGRGRIAD
ncbi:MAG: DUF6325 family protein [Acidimicrobiales bacterium]|jgi:hypothetical protein|nr:DUF6325 family protein [Acidimicrobiales bacterium]